jgi:hypothetical protein
MTNNKERDRILREARATLARPVEPYTPPVRMIGDHDPLEPDLNELEPKYTPEPERRQAQPPPAPLAADTWAGWEQWLETRLNAALAIQRHELVEIVAQVIADERESAERELAHQVRALRAEIVEAEKAVATLRAALDVERARIVDLPNPLPARRDLN